MSRTAYFIIDIQHDLAVDPANRIPHADRVLSRAEEVINAVRQQIDSSSHSPSRPLLVFVQHSEDPASGPLVEGSKAWELVFHPKQDHPNEWLVHKTTGNAFESNPNLASRLRTEGVGKVIALGIQSDCCVKATCEGALEAGFEVLLVKGAHGTFDVGGKSAEDVEGEVERGLERKGVRIGEWEGVVV